MRTRFNSLTRIGHYTGPLLQSHAVDDEIIPFRLGRELFLAVPGPKEFFVSEGLGHNAIEPPAYDDRLRQFSTASSSERASSGLRRSPSSRSRCGEFPSSAARSIE